MGWKEDEGVTEKLYPQRTKVMVLTSTLKYLQMPKGCK